VRNHCSRNAADGFTLIEVLVALTLVAAIAIGTLQLFVVAARSSASAQHQSALTWLAVQKIEQLSGLTMASDEATGVTLTDSSSNTADEPMTAGGTGLSISPPDSLDRNAPGYVDYVDDAGRLVSGGSSPPASAVYVRRWRIRATPGVDALAIDVLAITAAQVRANPSAVAGSSPAWPASTLSALRLRRPR
jgi:prepilin-type N-terminal cleavage/methylation domain-containing protein